MDPDDRNLDDVDLIDVGLDLLQKEVAEPEGACRPPSIAPLLYRWAPRLGERRARLLLPALHLVHLPPSRG